jgi:hypothetical protein
MIQFDLPPFAFALGLEAWISLGAGKDYPSVDEIIIRNPCKRCNSTLSIGLAN